MRGILAARAGQSARKLTSPKLNRHLFVPLFSFLIFTAPSLSQAQEKKALRTVSVSLTWNNQLPFRVAIAKGFFKDQGLSVETIFVRGGPTAIAALVSGNVDFANIGGAQAPIRSNARGLDLQIIASQSNNVDYTLLGNKEAKTIEDLRGKIIGVTGAGSFSDFAIRVFLKRNNLEPDRDVTLRAIGESAVRAVALERGLIAAAPFSAEDTVKLLDKGYRLIVNLNQALRIPQNIYVTRAEVLEKYPDTTKRFLKAIILGMQLTTHNKSEAMKLGYSAGLKGDPEDISRTYDLFNPGFSADLSIASDGIQIMLDEDIRSGLVDKKFTLDRVINDRILKQAQQELRNEGRLKP
jgi:NitT/TauT family transport system substrate-binding protein